MEDFLDGIPITRRDVFAVVFSIEAMRSRVFLSGVRIRTLQTVASVVFRMRKNSRSQFARSNFV